MRVEQHGLGVDLAKVREMQAERDMLLARLVADEDGDHELVGRSSTAMLIAALTGNPVRSRPYDVWDLNRCERTYEAAPAHLQARMTPTLEAFRALIVEEAAGRKDWFSETFEREHRPVPLTRKR